MRVMLTQRNQITIPKNMINELDLELGKFYELRFEENKIVLDISQSYDQIEDEKTIIEPMKKENITSNIKIESNLEEGKSFSRQVYSDCGLVIRTKRSYINKFCEVCQGQLAREYGIDNHPCVYNLNIEKNSSKENITLSSQPETPVETPVIKYEEPMEEIKKEEKPVKKIINCLTDNVEKLSAKLDKEIVNISKEGL